VLDPAAHAGGVVASGRDSRSKSWLRIRAVARPATRSCCTRNPQRWFDVMVWPVVDSILFGSIGVYFVRQHGGASRGRTSAAFLLAGIVLFHVVFQARGESRDRLHGGRRGRATSST